MPPLNRTNTSGMPYAGTFINHNNSANAATLTDGTHTDLTSVRPHIVLIHSNCISLCVFSACFDWYFEQKLLPVVPHINCAFIYSYQNIMRNYLPTAVSVGCEYEGTDSVQAAFHRCDEKTVSLHERDVHTSGGDRCGKFLCSNFYFTGGAIFSVHYVCTLDVDCC